MGKPVVSILLPVRNEERYLRAAVQSMQRQTLAAWEMVCVDDGSSDGTMDILAAAASRDHRVKIVRTGGTGLVDALNRGLRECGAPLVARMDGDDISHPRRLKRQLEYLRGNPDVGVVACDFRHFPRQRVGSGMTSYELWQNSLHSHEEIVRDLFVESPLVHPSVMFRKDLVDAVGGYRDERWAEDYDLWLRLAQAGVKFARLPELLFFWRERPDRTTRTHPAYSADAFRNCKAHHLCRGFLQEAESVALAGAGLEGRAWMRALAKRGITVRVWVDVDPRKCGRMLHGAPVIGPGEPLPRGLKMLVTVGTRGARQQIRKWADGKGLEEGRDYLCVT